jgi:hypothetical protein
VTEEQIKYMSNPDINRYLGENVMGWKQDDSGYWFNSYGSMMRSEREWIPAYSLDHAVDAVDKALGSQSYAITVGESWKGQPDLFFCLLRKKDGAEIHDIGYSGGSTRARSICNALLLCLTNKG